MPGQTTTPTLFDRGISQDGIAQARERFLQLNRERLLRTRSVLKPRHHLVLDLLPLLFHVNHPMLPGYSGTDTPCGLDGYQPTADALTRARTQFSTSFEYLENEQRAIHSIFLMGSSGTVAQTTNSDLDIWLCHRARLGNQALEDLRKKAIAITRWAETLGLEMHIFLMESEQFRQGQRNELSAESAGTSQHFLLLDEFYRSAVLLSGRYPIWWLVPPEEEIHYAEYTALLRSQGFVATDESIDFGGVADIPAGEFIGAGIWQLYKAISTPYKSILKLLLIEVYANEYPNVNTLSLALKKSVYQAQLDADWLDPYAMVYRKLERYLDGDQEPERLELVRRAFYFKTGQHLSRPSAIQTATQPEWQRAMLAKLVNSWQWSAAHLMNMDTQYGWKLRRVSEEHRRLVTELTNSYRFLQHFATTTESPALINSQEMNLLGRKLYAAFERKRNKIEWLNPGIALNLVEEQLFFRKSGYGNAQTWSLSNNDADAGERSDILFESDHICALLCWCHCNGLISKQTRLRLSGDAIGINERQLQRLSQNLKHHLPTTPAAADPTQHDAFCQPKRVAQILAYINLGHNALPMFGGSPSPSKDNAFPVYRTEIVIINSWGEVFSLVFDGDNVLVDSLTAFQQLLLNNSHSEPPLLHIQCSDDPQATLCNNLRDLAKTLRPYLQTSADKTRIVIKLGNGFHVLQNEDDTLKSVRAKNYPELLQILGRRQTSFSPVVLAPYCLAESSLAAAVALCTSADCHVFFQEGENGTSILFSDERGSILEQHFIGQALQDIAANLKGFLNAIRDEQQLSHQVKLSVLVRHQGRWQNQAFVAAGASSREVVLDARARHVNGRQVFDIACNGAIFRFQDYGTKQLDAVAQQLSELGTTRQPILLRKLYLGESGLQSSIYLRYKQHIESLLTSAVNDLYQRRTTQAPNIT
jgi:adenylate cyclase, class 1